MAVDDCILRGGMPELAITDTPPDVYYRAYLQSYLKRDVRQIANIRQASAFNRFLVLLAARTGQLLNLNSLSGEVGVSHTTLAKWLDVLEASFVVFRLRPYYRTLFPDAVSPMLVYAGDTIPATEQNSIDVRNYLEFD